MSEYDLVMNNEKSKIFDVIGNACRRKILNLLVLEPHYVSQLSKILSKSQPAILKHMRVLEDEGIVIRRIEQASTAVKGPDRHYFSINKSFTLMYSLSPHNVREKMYYTDSKDKNPDKLLEQVTPLISEEETVPKKVSIINKELEILNREMTNLEEKYIDLESKRNALLKLTNQIIESTDDLNTNAMYNARQLLRKHVCESRTCVQEISNLLNKKEFEIQKAMKVLEEKFSLTA